MAVFNNILAGAAGQGGAAGYQIDRSLRIDDVSNSTLTRTPSTAGNRKTWTLSFWIKRTEIGGNQLLFNAGNTSNGDHSVMRLNGDMFQMYQYGHSGDTTAWSGGNGSQLRTSAKFRDPSAWMHIVVAMDTTQATESDRLKYYINGVLQTEFDSTSYPAQNSNPGYWNAADLHCWGDQVQSTSVSGSADYYLAEVHMVDGQQLAASDFGEYDSNNVWQPKEYSGSYGTNGFHLDFSDNSSNAALGTDSSGNSNTWTVNNLSVADGSEVTVSTATGATPIRNTTGDQGGTAASGFRTDANASNLFLALPLNTDTSDVSNSINSNSTTKTTTNQSTATSSSQSRFYGASSYWNANTDGILVAESGSELVVGTGDFTIELWFYDDSNHGGGGSGRCVLFDNRIGGSVVGDPPTFVAYVDGSSTVKIDTPSYVISHTVSGGTDNKWIHLAAVRSSGTVTLYINGNSVGSQSDTTNYPNNGIGVGRATDGGYGWAGYIQDFRFYKTAKYTSDFSIPADANPTAGAGCDSLIDTPTNYTAGSGNNGGNYATLNPLAKGSAHTLSNGNLDFTMPVAGGSKTTPATMGVSSGKWYWEMNVTAVATYYPGIGIDSNPDPAGQSGDTATGRMYLQNGQKFNNATLTNYGASYAAGDVIAAALDMDGGTITFYKNGVSQGQAFSGITGTQFPVLVGHNSAAGSFNFGQRPFAYTPPTGFVSLCTQNLDDPLIADGSTAMDATIWSGDDVSGRDITGLNHSPDLVWIKRRNSASDWNVLFDSIRGGEQLSSNQTDAGLAQGSNVAGYVSAYNSDGFELTQGSNLNSVNATGGTYVGWTWDGGDLVTNSAYDQSQAWSTFGDSNAKTNENWTHVFDGNGTAGPHVVANSGSTTVWTPSTSISFTKLEIYANNDGYGDITLNGNISTTGTVPSGGGSSIGWADVTSLISNNTLTSIEVPNSFNSDPTRLGAIKVDDKYLVDPGVIPVSSLNSSVYDQSQTWTNQVSGTENSTYPFSNLFNGDNMATHAYPANGTEAVFTPNPSFSNATTVKIWYYAPNMGADGVKLNGTSVGNQLPTTSGTLTKTFDVTGTGFTSLAWSKGTNSTDSGLLRIDVDGKQLVDSSVSVANVPSIASTVRANPSAGFSIVSYTGNGTSPSTIGHGLNAVPGMILVKNRSSIYNWAVYHTGLIDGSTVRYLRLNTTDAKVTGSGHWKNTVPTSSVFSVGNDGQVNTNGDTYIAYCFAPVEGYSAFGSYEGNGSTSGDGPVVYTGMRPRWIMVKNIDTGDSSTDWFIYDTARSTFNAVDDQLYPNKAAAEAAVSTHAFDILSNGFKVRSTSTSGLSNKSGDTYIYAAFGDPFKTSRAR